MQPTIVVTSPRRPLACPGCHTIQKFRRVQQLAVGARFIAPEGAGWVQPTIVVTSPRRPRYPGCHTIQKFRRVQQLAVGARFIAPEGAGWVQPTIVVTSPRRPLACPAVGACPGTAPTDALIRLKASGLASPQPSPLLQWRGLDKGNQRSAARWSPLFKPTPRSSPTNAHQPPKQIPSPLRGEGQGEGTRPNLRTPHCPTPTGASAHRPHPRHPPRASLKAAATLGVNWR